jgi:hypothetical protein
MPKKDLVITAAAGYEWEQIRPFVISLDNTGFTGDKVVLASNLKPFTCDVLANRDWAIIQTGIPYGPAYVVRDRFIPLLRFLEQYGQDYRYVLWVDAGDQIFQSNPSEWFDKYAAPHNIICAREGWLIKDETRWNDPWVKMALPDDYDWLREYEVLCGGTVAGDPDTLYKVIKQIYEKCAVKVPSGGGDQAWLNYFVRKPFNVYSIIPDLNDGWCATLSSCITENFTSCCGLPKEKIAIAPPVFDVEKGLVLTPDGRKPFVLVHQYNRDGRWTYAMHTKYREW